jgi:DNA-binding GntR family transcriptional regulator
VRPLAQQTNKSSAEYAYATLRRRILNKEFQPGEHLPEIAIAQQLHISRTPVREAFRWLANEGLIGIFPNEGASIVNPSRQERADTIEVRAYLEVLSFRKAIHRITPVQLCMLDEEIAKEEAIFATRDLDRYLDVNTRFHKIIARASGNVALCELVENLLSRSFIYMVLFESFLDFDTNPSLDEHRELVRLLREKREEEGVALLQRHILGNGGYGGDLSLPDATESVSRP